MEVRILVRNNGWEIPCSLAATEKLRALATRMNKLMASKRSVIGARL